MENDSGYIGTTYPFDVSDFESAMRAGARREMTSVVGGVTYVVMITQVNPVVKGVIVAIGDNKDIPTDRRPRVRLTNKGGNVHLEPA
jgi:hypothetical protein